MNINETHPREKAFSLWGHCQNILDDPRNARKREYSQERNNYTLYTGQLIWHREEETKNDNRNMTYRRQYSL